MFFLAEMANSENMKPQSLKPIVEFSIKEASHKTPTKNAKIEMAKSTYTPSFTESSKKRLINVHKLEKGKLRHKTADWMSKWKIS